MCSCSLAGSKTSNCMRRSARGQEEEQKKLSGIDLYQGSERRPVIEPGGGLLWHCHTAVSTSLPAIYRIKVPDIGSRTVHSAPPGVMQEISASMPLQCIVDMCWWMPVR